MHPTPLPQDEQVQEPVAFAGFRVDVLGAVSPTSDASNEDSVSPLATVEQLLVEAAIQRPEAEALVGDFGTLSYADLLIRAQNIAVVLRQQGVGSGQFVGVAMDQSPVTIASIAGILLAGAAYVPLERDLLQDARALQSIRTSGMTFILCDRSHGTGSCMLWSEFGTVLDASRMEQQTMPSSTEIRLPATAPDSAAALLFRRSRGHAPENLSRDGAVGVVIPHRAIARLVSSNLLTSHANETFLLHPAGGTRSSLLELWGSLLHGATLALAPDVPAIPSAVQKTSVASRVDQLALTIRRFGVSTLCVPVSALHDLIDREPKAFASLNNLVVEQDGSSGALSPQRLQWLSSAYPRLHIVHSYGTIETSGYATCYPVPAKYVAQASVPVGEPIAGMQAVILDRELFPTREGEIGELAFAGDGVVSGYLRDADATAQHFLRRGTSDDSADAHVFLTGQRARWRSDGLLELHGRSAQHHMAPQWLEPKRSRDFGAADIEAMLMGQQKVRDAAILEEMDAAGLPLHVAFVALDPRLPKNGTSHEMQTSLETAMRSALPPDAMPSAFHYVESIPRDGDGSVDPSLLTRRNESSAVLDERRQQETLDQVRAIWLRLLQRVSVDCDEDFFDAGGTQVQMIRMHVELNRRYPGAITMANLSVLRTMRKIYEHLMERARQKVATSLAGHGA